MIKKEGLSIKSDLLQNKLTTLTTRKRRWCGTIAKLMIWVGMKTPLDLFECTRRRQQRKSHQLRINVGVYAWEICEVVTKIQGGLAYSANAVLCT
jgi:hypothetical protein